MVALVIIYNHRFDKNIARLEELYKGRFSHIFHLMPFYDGDKENVIPVYEHSFNFQGYMAQGYNVIKKVADFDHFLFIGDDLFPNPELNENNYKEFLNIDYNTSFFPEFIETSKNFKWVETWGILNYSVKMRGLEVMKELPPKDEVLSQFKKHGFEAPFVVRPKKIRLYLAFLKYKIKTKRLFTFGRINLQYPLITGYSDFTVLDKESMPKFAKYCGVFAAGNLFVESAIPTAMVMSCKNIKTESDIDKKGLVLWRQDRVDFETKYNNSLKDLFADFPSSALFVHPIKLSVWKND